MGAPASLPPAQARRREAAQLAEAADRLDELADVAELMDDHATEQHFRRDAERRRQRAMALLD
jgi:hypothetical protein